MVFEKKQIKFNHTNLSWLLFVLLMPIAGFWRAWQWYFNRVNSSVEEAVGLIAIFIFLTFIAVRLLYQRKSYYQFSLQPVAVMLLVYGLSFFLPIPSIIRAAMAFMTISIIVYWTSFGKHPPIAFWALVMLSLPIVPSLQFYLGYPARYISASIAVPLLQMNGLSVTQSGTYLVWQNQMVQFDAPCSGVTMLWAGLFFSLFISLVYRFNLLKMVFALFASCIIVLFGNVLRATSLFYIEAGFIKNNQPWLHEGIGVIAFLATAFGILVTLSRFQQWSISRSI